MQSRITKNFSKLKQYHQRELLSMPYAVKKLFQRQHLPVHRLKRLSTLMTVPVQKHVYVIHLIDYVICKVECVEKFETSFHVKIKLTLS